MAHFGRTFWEGPPSPLPLAASSPPSEISTCQAPDTDREGAQGRIDHSQMHALPADLLQENFPGRPSPLHCSWLRRSPPRETSTCQAPGQKRRILVTREMQFHVCPKNASVLYDTYCTVSYSEAQCSTAQGNTVQHSTAQSCTVLYPPSSPQKRGRAPAARAPGVHRGRAGQAGRTAPEAAALCCHVAVASHSARVPKYGGWRSFTVSSCFRRGANCFCTQDSATKDCNNTVPQSAVTTQDNTVL